MRTGEAVADFRPAWGGARREVPAMRSCSGPEAVILDLALVGSLRAPCARGVVPCLLFRPGVPVMLLVLGLGECPCLL